MVAAKLTYRQVIPINAHHVTITVLKDPDHSKTDICFFNRLLVEVSNTRAGLTPQGKHMHFTRVAFSYHGNQLVAGDQHGNIYQLNITKNRCLCVHSAHVHCMGNGHSIAVSVLWFISSQGN